MNFFVFVLLFTLASTIHSVEDYEWSNKKDCIHITGRVACGNVTGGNLTQTDDRVANLTIEVWDEDGGLRGDADLMA